MTTDSGESTPPSPDQEANIQPRPGDAPDGDASQSASPTSEWVGFAMQFVNDSARTHSLADAIASNLTPEHVAEIIAQKGREPEYADRQSEREHDAGKQTRLFAVLIVIVAILAVVAIIVFLTIYQQAGLLGYILSGIGGLIAGAFGGYGYANRPR